MNTTGVLKGDVDFTTYFCCPGVAKNKPVTAGLNAQKNGNVNFNNFHNNRANYICWKRLCGRTERSRTAIKWTLRWDCFVNYLCLCNMKALFGTVILVVLQVTSKCSLLPFMYNDFLGRRSDAVFVTTWNSQLAPLLYNIAVIQLSISCTATFKMK